MLDLIEDGILQATKMRESNTDIALKLKDLFFVFCMNKIGHLIIRLLNLNILYQISYV